VRVFYVWDADSREQICDGTSFAQARAMLCRHGVVSPDAAARLLTKADDGSEVALEIAGFVILAEQGTPG
jgi:hypothetical protein